MRLRIVKQRVFIKILNSKGGIPMKKSTMSVQELSSHMGISLPKAYELVKEPGFPTIKVGTRILIPVEGFNEWLKRKYEE